MGTAFRSRNAGNFVILKAVLLAMTGLPRLKSNHLDHNPLLL